MNPLEWSLQYKKLCKRYRRKPDDDECEEYYETLSYCEYDILVETVKSLGVDSRYFPIPIDIQNRYREKRGEGWAKSKRAECSICEGVRFFYLPKDDSPYQYVAPCAHCMKVSESPQVSQKPDGSLWWAYRKVKKQIRDC